MNSNHVMSFSECFRLYRSSEHVRPGRSVLRRLLTGCLVVGLVVTSAGCSSNGSNGDQTEPAPQAPSGLSATSGNGEVELAWESAQNADRYRVYRATSSTNGASGTPLETNITSTDYTDTSAENGTKYFYRVTAVAGEDSESDASGEATVTPFAEPPSRP